MNYKKAKESSDFIRSRFDKQIGTAIVLGSGLGAFADEIENAVTIPYKEIPHFAKVTVEGHAGRLVLGNIQDAAVAVMQGRFHFYEGYEMEDVVFPVRVLGVLGVKNLILTNAAGSLSTELKPGSLMLITDHINLTGANPLRGKNDERFGPRFPDMSEVYSKDLQQIASEAAAAIANEREEKEVVDLLQRGVYCGLSGPTYETPAEIHMLRLLGADAVGMSTVPEAIAAHHMGMKVLGISCITNFAAGMTDEPIEHGHVIQTGAKSAEIFKELLRRIIGRIDRTTETQRHRE